MRIAEAIAATLAAVAAVATPLAATAAERWIAYGYASEAASGEAALLQQLGEAIAVATSGDVTVEQRLAGTLDVAPSDILAAVEDGEIQLALDGLYVDELPAARVPHLPMLANGPEAFEKAMAAVEPALTAALAGRGVVLLAHVRYPPEILWSATPIATPADLAGRRVRVTTPDQGDVVTALGGTPLTFAATDVPEALEAGLVDTVFTAAPVIADRWGDRLTHGYRLAPTRFSALLLVSKAAFDVLAPDVQANIRETAGRFAFALTTRLEAEDAAALERLSAGGVTVDAPTPQQLRALSGDMIELWNAWATAQGGNVPTLLSGARTAVAQP